MEDKQGVSFPSVLSVKSVVVFSLLQTASYTRHGIAAWLARQLHDEPEMGAG